MCTEERPKGNIVNKSSLSAWRNACRPVATLVDYDEPGLPPFERIGPAQAVSPLVLAVPHAGRCYPDALRAASAVPMTVLEQLEDRYADQLVMQAVDDGAVAIVARIARAWIDLNRGEDDLDPRLHPGADGRTITARARSGLGLIPRRVGRRELWREGPDARAVAARIAQVHRPYHAAVAAALAEAHRQYGYAILLDCHSMPSLAGGGGAQIVFGDRHGMTADAAVIAAVADVALQGGYRTAINAPYAGAHAIERHGNPSLGSHAVQIEIDRALYLRPDLRTPSAGVEGMSRLIAAIGQAALSAAAPALAIAAE